jgi:hypothetical protein
VEQLELLVEAAAMVPIQVIIYLEAMLVVVEDQAQLPQVLVGMEAIQVVAVVAVAQVTASTQGLVVTAAMAMFVSLHSSKETQCQDNSY